MSSLVKESLKKAQQSQKAWYDQTARDRTLNDGDMVLVLFSGGYGGGGGGSDDEKIKD